ncbi:MAG TPA: CRISPR-associated helicase Cas3' [Candidatus Accumulibacter phosphatis]|nr:MAG: CRISPR-associated endonuclease/helicase Cas3 [Candidatus Accumulibacter sp. SK-11]HAY29526.1 CRISPR-associated helicase/endonuclease Cas3 [Accumulibacter sp.]HCV13128.1 CRISPR-associated helicase/endonuclease Cas3 [Accumulibacter sp.]HRL74355.1 CRISPR-associated helicase Cas3' [Candidatus Accumulibacter phosphatis]HRQ95342.1 CRISPR-associated helicase Cas3' [Candidatus Accumulibacter phosphatis]
MRDEAQSYFRYWGKARATGLQNDAYHLLVYHCLDVAAVGTLYLRRSPALLDIFRHLTGFADDERLLKWLAFWLALHDVGKFAEAFQGQQPHIVASLRGREPLASKTYSLRHDSLGWLFWTEVLRDKAAAESWFGARTSSALKGLDWWARAVTGHHGMPPQPASDWLSHFDRDDRAAICAFVAELLELFLPGEPPCLPSADGARRFSAASRDASWWLAGLTVLADWLGSNSDRFTYVTAAVPLREYWLRSKGVAVQALEASGVLPAAQRVDVSFGDLFPGIQSPSPLQNWACRVELSPGPQIYILEDVTGAGKTEAALKLAQRLMAAGRADGFFVALPTMATANAMYGRIASVYRRLFMGNASLVLANGQRDLVELFAASVVPPGPADTSVGDETATARCTAWLADHNKRALLAPAGVGTIDQALLAVLTSKHQCLRLLGLLRKVLVVDEVHACDAYMQRVLETLLEFHARSGGSAILLSATLTDRMKEELVEAFAHGCRADPPRPAAASETPYPLVSRWSPARPDVLEQKPLGTRFDVRRPLGVRYISEPDLVVGVIEAALAAGKCVCWMRNTVADALDAHSLFQERIPADRIILFHARFALRDRLHAEDRVLAAFGKDSTPESRAGRLVIATQVVEQSLDADWDLVISDLAPVDRLIQRAGRLQRHPRDTAGRRLADPRATDMRGTPCLWVLGPVWEENPDAAWFTAAFPRAAKVYPHHGQLWLTAQALRKADFITMPDDARRLIECVFGGETPLPEALEENAMRAVGQAYADAAAAQQNTVKLGNGYVHCGLDWWGEAKSPSRLGEVTATVVLACWRGDQLKLWAPGALAYSSLRVAERLIAEAMEPEEMSRRAEFNRFRQDLPDHGKWSVVLALDETPEGWIGEAWRQPLKGQRERARWQYCAKLGLRQVVAPSAAHSALPRDARGTDRS